MEKLSKIQKELKAPKNQFNSFGKYPYRSCEDILEAVKPLLNGAVLTLSDEVVEVGGRIYVKATARFIDGDFSLFTTAYAREPEDRKGMDASQITGTASSYSRKYCLNGMFLIDDTKDADTMDNTRKAPVKATPAPQAPVEDIQDFISPEQLKAVDDLLNRLSLNRENLGTWLKETGRMGVDDVTKMDKAKATRMIEQWDTFSADVVMNSMNQKPGA